MHIKRESNSDVIDGVIALELKPTIAADSITQPGPGSQASRAAVSKLSPEQAKERLTQARNMLKGENKDTQQAKGILVSLAQNHALLLRPADRCYLYVYLAYIEDLAGSREMAVGWYRRASELDGPKIEGIRAVARQGLTNPVKWIRHLDSGSKRSEAQSESASGSKNNVVERIGKGFVLRNEPEDGDLPKMNLSKAERLENFGILAEAIYRNYSFFVHKQIDWQEVKSRYRPKVEMARTTKEFYSLIHQFVMELKDFHSWLCNYKDIPALGRFSPQMSIRLIEGKAVVTEVVEGSQAHGKGLRAGSVIIAVDGSTVRSRVTKARRLMHMYSSERCFLEQAYRRILDGEKGSTLSVRFLGPGGKSPRIVRLRRVSSRKQEVIAPNFRVNKGKFIWYGIHPSGCGYIRILSFKGRMEIADEFDRALDRLKDKPGLIIDVRENPGGFGTAQARIVGRFIADRTKVDISYAKSGPGHKDFTKHENYFGPAGNWQYGKPIVLLINAITGSAADLFACRMISTGRPITIGTTTHGNLTGRGVYVVLPCNLVVRVSGGYVCDATGRIIEGNGSVPQIRVERTIADVVNGTDSVIERAVVELRGRSVMLRAIPKPFGLEAATELRVRQLALPYRRASVFGGSMFHSPVYRPARQSSFPFLREM